jgi:aldose 1-epimerase
VDAGVYRLTAGELEAVFLPGRGMLGVSLRYRGEELLRRLENLDAAAAKGSTAGIPLLYPWANRLAGAGYRASGHEVSFDPASSLLHCDDHGRPIHGVKWALLNWHVISSPTDQLVARLDWTRDELLAVFPFRHAVEMKAALAPSELLIEVKVKAQDALPVSFGFHPYFGIAGVPRAEWRLELPVMSRIVLDNLGIPTGEEENFDQFDGLLGELEFDAGFRVMEQRPRFVLSGAGRRISVEFLENFPYAQVFAPKGKEFVALEPMTAPTNALLSGQGLRVMEPGREFRAAFRIGVA